MMELLGTVMKQISDYLGMHEQNNQNNYATFYYQGSESVNMNIWNNTLMIPYRQTSTTMASNANNNIYTSVYPHPGTYDVRDKNTGYNILRELSGALYHGHMQWATCQRVQNVNDLQLMCTLILQLDLDGKAFNQM